MINTLETNIKCPVCDSPDATFLFHPVDYSGLTSRRSLAMVKCKGCGLIRLDPRLTESDVAQIYKGGYWDLSAHGDGLEELLYRHYRYRVRFLASVARPGRILDVGCGHGGYVWLLRKLGWLSFGLKFGQVAAG